MKVCMIGTGGSGKTAYLYLMIKRMAIGPESCTTYQGDSYVHQEIDMNRWPLKTDYLRDDGSFKPSILRINRMADGKPSSVHIPDISGAWFEDLDELHKAVSSGKQRAAPQLFSRDAMHKNQMNILRYINECCGTMLFVDLQLYVEKEKTGEWYRHLHQASCVLDLVREQAFVPESPSRFKRPLMIVLSKSDLVKKRKDAPGMYEAGQKVHDYLMDIGGHAVIAAANNLHEDASIIYTMHSSVVETKRSAKGEKSLPNYEACFKYPYEEYTRQFIQFLERLNDK